MEDIQKQQAYAVVTGASKGIGKEIAHELARRGHSLVLTARSEELLEELAQEIRTQYEVDARFIPLDLSLDEAPQQLLDFCKEGGLRVNILVNNAGFGVWARFEDEGMEAWEGMNALNVTAMLRISHLFIPVLKAEKKSHLLNVASLAAYQPVPNFTLYAAGKSYIRSFSRGLREEMKVHGMKVSCLCPGGVWTSFTERAGTGPVAKKMAWTHMDAKRCAKITVRKMLRGRAEIIPGFINQLSAFFTRLLPTGTSARMAGKIFKQD